jgi:uncharacterized protein
MAVDWSALIARYYDPDSRTYEILVEHGRAVAGRALDLASRVPGLNPDLNFIAEAALIHDIGMFLTHAPQLGCLGPYPYVCHGYLGRQLMDRHGLPAHGLVCERHVGAGICAKEIGARSLPLPLRDMLPVTIEEQIICYADKFFSKKAGSKPRCLEKVRRQLAPFGPLQMARFEGWAKLFGDA